MAEPIELFARGVWKKIPSENDVTWVERLSKEQLSNQPLGDFGTIINEMIEKGVSKETIARFAKLVGYETAFGLCYHLEDPVASYEGFPKTNEQITWGLFRVDPDTNEPIEGLNGIHEVLLGLVPSGREMRPKNT